MKFYTYWRSTAAYRVRIALNLKGVEARHIPVHLVSGGGEQHGEHYRLLNPGQTVPTLVLDSGTAITQSLAIIAYLNEAYREPPLLPGSNEQRACIRAAAEVIACDIHPLNNLRVTQYLKHPLGHDHEAIIEWMHRWMRAGLTAFMQLAKPDTEFSFSGQPSLADLCLVPQLYNARRWKLDLSSMERLVSIEQNCLALRAFADARPECQPDAEVTS